MIFVLEVKISDREEGNNSPRLPTDGSDWIDDGGERAEPAGPGAEDRGLPVNEGERCPHLLAGRGESVLLHRAVVHLCLNLFEIYDRDACTYTKVKSS